MDSFFALIGVFEQGNPYIKDPWMSRLFCLDTLRKVPFLWGPIEFLEYNLTEGSNGAPVRMSVFVLARARYVPIVEK